MTKTGGVEANKLKSYIERIERLEEDKKAVADDVRDVFAEAKANGFDIDDSFFTDVDVEDKLFDGMKGYYNVIFDHEFARSFWKEDIGIDLIMDDHPDGEIPKTVDLVATLHEGKHPIAALFLNEESVRIPLWQYNLSQMVLSEDPLMYIKNTLVEAGLMKP